MTPDDIRDRIRARLDTMPEAHHVPIVYATRSLIRDRDPLDALLDAFAALARENLDLLRAVQRYAANAPPAPIILQGVDGNVLATLRASAAPTG